nr:MAG TPA: hypothetical protein [Caudoviricetes sp.]
MHKEKRKAEQIMESKMYITPETREEIYKTAKKRSTNRVIEIEMDLMQILDQILKEILTKDGNRQDIIIQTPERVIGKTSATMAVAAEWGIPLICKEQERNNLGYIAAERYKSEDFMIIEENTAGKTLRGTNIRIALKTESVKASKIRKILDAASCERVTIIGFEEV